MLHLLSHSLFSLEIMVLQEIMNNSLVAKGVKNSEVLVAKGEPQADSVLKVIKSIDWVALMVPKKSGV